MLLSKPMLAVRHAVSTDKSRGGLSGVRLDPSNNRAIATNGHFALVATSHGEDKSADFPVVPGKRRKPLDHPVTIPIAAVEAIRKAIPKPCSMPVLSKALVTNGEPGRVSLHATDLDTWNTQEAQTVNESFPDVNQVIPPAGVKIGFNPKYLMAICKAVIEARGTLRGSGYIALTFPAGPDAELKPIRIDAEGDEVTITGALMPMRI